MHIDVRQSVKDDIPVLQKLIPESVRSLSQGYYTEGQIESALKYIFGVDSQLVADGTYYTAFAGEQIVACGGWSRRRTLFGGDQMKSDADDLLDPARDPARIRAFFVHPLWARRGIGKQIIQICEESALREGFRTMELVATLPGEPLYAALGYEVTTRFDVTMPDGILLPVVGMMKSLG